MPLPLFTFRGNNVPRKANVYVGIDFGTTFCKVAFRVASTQIATLSLSGEVRSIKFSNSGIYHPTTLGYIPNEQKLVFSLEKLSTPKVAQYFKYDVMQPQNRLSNIEGVKPLENDPARLCSAFYLAHIISYVKQVIRQSPDVRNYSELIWHINMGVPVNSFIAKPVTAYDEVLKVAYLLNEDNTLLNTCELTHLDRKYTELKSAYPANPSLRTIPELYAEIILFLQSSAIGEGLYTVVDIGGGTVDIAVFLKGITNNTPEVQCISQTVSPIGHEIFKKSPSNPHHKKVMNQAYGNALMDAYKRFRMRIQDFCNNRIPHKVFLLGGGRDEPFYKARVIDMAQLQSRSVTLPNTEIHDIMDYLKYQVINDSLKVEIGNHRLLIAQMLAQPYDAMPQLRGQPWAKKP